MRRYGCVLVVLALAIEQAVLADTFEAASQRREQTFRTVAFDIEVVEVVPKGQGEVDHKTRGAKAKVPVTDQQTKSRNRLTLDGPRGRYDNNQPLWSIGRGRFLDTGSVLVADGTVGKLYFPRGISGASAAQGFIEGDSPNGLRSTVLTPIMLNCRGLSPTFSAYIASDFKRSENVLDVAGRRCQEYIRTRSPSDSTSLFVDEAEQFLARRIRKLTNGKTTYQADITYRAESIGTVVSGWTTTEFDATGDVKLRRDVKVVEFTAAPAISDDTFRIVFPEGCEVYDGRTQKHYVAGGDETLKEVDARGNELEKEIVQPGASWWRRNRSALVWIALVGVLAATIRFVLRRRRAVPLPQ